MEPINNNLRQMVHRLNLTEEEIKDEPYILTKEEEERLLSNAIKRAREHKEWKMRQILKTAEEVDLKLSQIVWEHEIDREAILKLGNSVKHHELWQQEQRKKEKEKEERERRELQEIWTTKKVFSLMKWSSVNTYDKTLVVNDHNKKLISALCFLVSNDARYENEYRYSFNKGLLIRGASGLGKTHLADVCGREAVTRGESSLRESARADLEDLLGRQLRLRIGLSELPIRPPFGDHVGRVLRARAEKMVSGITARTDIAAMEHEQARRHRAVGQLPRDAVSAQHLPASAARVKGSIAVGGT